MLKTLANSGENKFTLTSIRGKEAPIDFYGNTHTDSKTPLLDAQILDLNLTAAAAALGMTSYEITEHYKSHGSVTWNESDDSPLIHSPQG